MKRQMAPSKKEEKQQMIKMEKEGRSLIAVTGQKKTNSLKFTDIRDAVPH